MLCGLLSVDDDAAFQPEPPSAAVPHELRLISLSYIG